MIKRHPVSNTYARAIMELATELDRVDEIFEELEWIQTNIYSVRDFRIFFESPKIPRVDKKKALEASLKGRVSSEVLHFLEVLIDRGRQMPFAQIMENVTERYDELKKRIHVRVCSAVGLNEDSRTRLTKLLGERLDREIVMQDSIDADLLGGMTIRFGDTFVDGSIRTQLDKVREAVASPHLGSDLFDEN